MKKTFFLAIATMMCGCESNEGGVFPYFVQDLLLRLQDASGKDLVKGIKYDGVSVSYFSN